jgi:hypothetical protein
MESDRYQCFRALFMHVKQCEHCFNLISETVAVGGRRVKPSVQRQTFTHARVAALKSTRRSLRPRTPGNASTDVERRLEPRSVDNVQAVVLLRQISP